MLLVVMVGCHAYLSKALSGKPDLQIESGPAVYLHGGAAPTELPAMLEVIHAQALSACPASQHPELEHQWSQVLIEWAPLATVEADCGRAVGACQPSAYSVEVSSANDLPDELGHLVWETCFGSSGETTWTDGGITYDPTFYGWVTTARELMLQVALPKE